jgi:predicted nucleic-acid-binding Zn-ribbon protein
MMKKEPQFMAVYCQHCGFIDQNVSVIAIETIRAIAQTEYATIQCKQCGNNISVNFSEDMMKVKKNGKYELKETTQW